jgi:AcrR family transcriptional regulator
VLTKADVMGKLETTRVSDVTRERDVAVTKDGIADVFEKHVQRFGYAKTTLDEVARDLGISKKTLYVHFQGKADIYAYLVARLAKESRRAMADAIAPLPTYREKVRALTGIVIGQARGHILETAESDWRQEFEVAADAFRDATGSLLRELVEDGIGAGEFAVTDAALCERMLGAMLVEYSLMMRQDPALDEDKELTEAILRFLG